MTVPAEPARAAELTWEAEVPEADPCAFVIVVPCGGEARWECS